MLWLKLIGAALALLALLYGLAALFGAWRWDAGTRELRGTSEMAQGELMRYLAEAPWYPSAPLPSQGVRWEAVDERSARATLRDGDTVATLTFTFDDAGLVDSVRAEARRRTVQGAVVPTPGQGRWWNYGERGGMKVPLEGEVAWMLPAGAKAYWRGRLTKASYEFAP